MIGNETRGSQRKKEADNKRGGRGNKQVDKGTRGLKRNQGFEKDITYHQHQTVDGPVLIRCVQRS